MCGQMGAKTDLKDIGKLGDGLRGWVHRLDLNKRVRC